MISIKCPHCGASYYSVNYRITTCIGWTPVYKDGVQVNQDPNKVSLNCTCCNCGQQFTCEDKDPTKDEVEKVSDSRILNILKEKIEFVLQHEVWGGKDVYFLKVHPIDWDGFSEELFIVDLDVNEYNDLLKWGIKND